jgi:uncharacterized membrane protein YjjP (DUF1212 family)
MQPQKGEHARSSDALIREDLVIELGRAFHQAGVPADTLEEVMRDAARILAVDLQVTALPTSITAAIGAGYAQRVVLLRLEPGTIDLRRLALLNVVFDRIAARKVEPAAALAEVRGIEALVPRHSSVLIVLAYCILAFGAAIILGGGAQEIAAAALIGVSTGLIAVVGKRVGVVARLFEVLAAFSATLIVAAYKQRVPELQVYVPLVAGLIQLVPGLSLTAALHELADRHLVAGTSRLGGVLLTLLELGCGVALAIALEGSGQLHIESIVYAGTPWYLTVLAVAAMATAIAILENARFQDYPWVLAACAIAKGATFAFAALPGHQVSTFGAAFVVGIVAALSSRFARVPQAVLLIPALLVLVPGSLSYASILSLLQRDAGDAAAIALNTAIAAIEIVAGLLLSQLVAQGLSRGRRHAPAR